MDNQQVKTHFEIGWLVGFIEGEGCLTINLTKGINGNKFICYMSITGTNRESMDVAIDIAKRLNLPFHVSERKYSKHIEKKAIRIEVCGMSRVSKWLDIVEPHLHGKKGQAILLRQFIDNRNKVLKLHPYLKPYTDEDLSIYEQIHALNRGYNRPKAKTPETTRRPWQQVKI